MNTMNRIMQTVLFCMLFLLCGCEPVAEYWILRGFVFNQNPRAVIDSVDVFLSTSQLFGYSNVLTDATGLFEHYRGSRSVKDFNGLRKLDFHFIFSKSGFATLDTIILGDAFRYGSEGNYQDTIYLDSIFLQAIP